MRVELPEGLAMSGKWNIPEVIVALDVEEGNEALKLVRELKGKVDYFKIGSRLFTAEGPALIEKINSLGCSVFLDLKFHDIPATVAGSVRAACSHGVRMMTLHTTGGVEMMKAAVREVEKKFDKFSAKRPLLVGVTVLTSISREDLEIISTAQDEISDIVLKLAAKAKEAGLDGIVSSALETERIRKEFGKDFVIVTPGIRPSGYSTDDQKRVATPKSAAKAGSNFLVIGRPVYRASSPALAVDGILRELKE